MVIWVVTCVLYAAQTCRNLRKKTGSLSFFLFCPVREYLTGFHKRKVERRKAAEAEIRKKIKEEQIRVREEVSVKCKSAALKTCFGSTHLEPCEHILMCLAVCFQRHKEYIKMLKERTDALGEFKANVILLIGNTWGSALIVYFFPPHLIPSLRGRRRRWSGRRYNQHNRVCAVRSPQPHRHRYDHQWSWPHRGSPAWACSLPGKQFNFIVHHSFIIFQLNYIAPGSVWLLWKYLILQMILMGL